MTNTHVPPDTPYARYVGRPTWADDGREADAIVGGTSRSRAVVDSGPVFARYEPVMDSTDAAVAGQLDRHSALLVASRQDVELVGVLFTEMWPTLVRRLTSQVGDPEVAADLASETFARVVLTRHRFDPRRSDARSWVWTIASSLVRGVHRHGVVESKSRRRLGVQLSAPSDVVDEVVERVWADEIGPELNVALSGLPEQTQDVVRWRAVEGQSFEEIARRLETTEGAARLRFHRAVTDLRTSLGREGAPPR